MSSGFSPTGASDESEQADQAECGRVAGVIRTAIEQRTVGAGVLSAPGDQREFIPTLAIDVTLIERKGVEAFALREAARKVGVSANAAYHHFEDKDALLSAVASSGFAELATQREAARSKAAADACSKLAAGAKVYVQFAETRPKLFDLMFGPLGVGSKTAPSSRKPYQQLSEALDNLVLSGRLTPQQRTRRKYANDDLVAARKVLERAAQNLLALTSAVHISCIEVVDTQFERTANETDGCPLRSISRRAVRLHNSYTQVPLWRL